MRGAAAGGCLTAAVFLCDVLRVPVSTALEDPKILSSVPPLGALVAAVVLSALGGAWLAVFLGKRGRAAALHPLLLPGVGVLAYIPGAVTALPILAAATGRVLALILFASIAASLWRWGKDGTWRLGSNQVALAAFTVYLMVGSRMQTQVGLSGDEPHYLVITYSILHDGDLEVADNYAGRDFESFHSGRLNAPLAWGTHYSVYGLGLPLILLPGFAIGGLKGVLVTEAILGAWIARETFRLAQSLMGPGAALVATAGLALSAPALFLCTSAYPELPAAAITITVFRRALDPGRPGQFSAAGWGLACGLLPWLHMKFIPLSLVLGVVLFARWPGRRRSLALGQGIALASVPLFYMATLGSPNPAAAYGRPRVFPERIPLGLAGLLFDQEFGLLPTSPFFFLGLVGVGTLARRWWILAGGAAGVLLAVALPGAAHPLWFGGTSPPARFLFPALPLVAVSAGYLWSLGKGVASWTPTLLLWSLVLGAYMALGPDPPLHLNQKDGTGRIFESLGESWDLTHYFPSLIRADPRSLAMAKLGGALLMASALAVALAPRWRWPMAVASLMGFSALIDHVSPGAPAAPSELRWSSTFLSRLPAYRGRTFVELPAGQARSYPDVLSQVEVPLMFRPASDGRTWSTRPFALPAGRYLLRAPDRSATFSVCNGPGCFETWTATEEFETTVRLERFRVEALREYAGLSLKAQVLLEGADRALCSSSSPSGLRVHALDDHVYFEPEGLWVRAGRRSELLFEGACTECVVRLSNGGEPNWAWVRWEANLHQFALAAWETKRLQMPSFRGRRRISVESRSGFIPAELDPRNLDGRALGLFVTAEAGSKASDRLEQR